MQSIRGMGYRVSGGQFLPTTRTMTESCGFGEGIQIRLKDQTPAARTCRNARRSHLGKPDRDMWIDRYNEFTRALWQSRSPCKLHRMAAQRLSSGAASTQENITAVKNPLSAIWMRFCPDRSPTTRIRGRRFGPILNISWTGRSRFARGGREAGPPPQRSAEGAVPGRRAQPDLEHGVLEGVCHGERQPVPDHEKYCIGCWLEAGFGDLMET